MIRELLLAVLFFLIAVSLTFADAAKTSSSKPKSTATHVAGKETSDGNFKVHLRPLITTMYPGDSFQVAIHFSGKDKPLDPFGQAKTDMSKLLGSLTWTVQTPSGTKYELTGAATDGRQKWLKGNQSLGRQATQVIALNHQGLKTIGAAGGITVTWASDKPFPKFEQLGTYQLSVKGRLQLDGKTTDVALPPVKFKVDKSVQPRSKAFETAIGALAKHVPASKLMKHGSTESGYERDVIHEDEHGNRLVDLNTSKAGFKWGYDLIRVTVSPKGRVLRMQEREVFTCIAEGVMIDTPTGQHKIESLKRGDQVWAYDTTATKRVITTVKTIRRGVASETVTLMGALRLTLNHPVFADGKWKAAGELLPTDQLLTRSGVVAEAGKSGELGNRTPIEMTRQIGHVNVFDLTVGNPHNFFAGSILVHNKDRAWSQNLDDTWYFTWPTKPHKWTTLFQADD